MSFRESRDPRSTCEFIEDETQSKRPRFTPRKHNAKEDPISFNAMRMFSLTVIRIRRMGIIQLGVEWRAFVWRGGFGRELEYSIGISSS